MIETKHFYWNIIKKWEGERIWTKFELFQIRRLESQGYQRKDVYTNDNKRKGEGKKSDLLFELKLLK